MKAFAKCLKGANNREEKAFFFLGTGKNGKGLVQTFVECALGDLNGYCQSINHSVLMLSKQSDNRSVELHSIRKKRMTSLSEPPQDITFDADTFKKWTGKDTVATRNNYAKEMTNFVPNTLFSQSNGKFNFSNVDAAVIRRICCVRHPYTFKDKAEYKSENKNEADKLDPNA